jgi:hypothetical protein
MRTLVAGQVADQLASLGRRRLAADVHGQVFEAPSAEIGAGVRQQALDVVLETWRLRLGARCRAG